MLSQTNLCKDFILVDPWKLNAEAGTKFPIPGEVLQDRAAAAGGVKLKALKAMSKC